MATKTVNTRMQQVVKTDEQWISTIAGRQPLLLGEIGFDYKSQFFKVGDGNTLWNNLMPYVTTPVGSIIMTGDLSGAFYGSFGFLLCDGRDFSRTQYSDLFNIIGTKYGSGNGSTTFNVPSLVDRFPKGASNPWTNGYITGGRNSFLIKEDEMPQHRHANANRLYIDSSSTEFVATGGSGRWLTTAEGTYTGYAGGATLHNNEPAYTVFRYFIKY